MCREQLLLSDLIDGDRREKVSTEAPALLLLCSLQSQYSLRNSLFSEENALLQFWWRNEKHLTI
jgi:hypothetical protein